MANAKKNVSVYFKDKNGENHFLLQVLNVGKDKDELKFIFNDPDSNTGTCYTETKGALDDTALIRLRPEITYHNDGSFLHKLVGYKHNPTVYRNPKGPGVRRTPLNEIENWGPIIKIRIVDYELCRKSTSSNIIFMPENQSLFDGKPLECRIFLGGKSNKPLHDSQMAISLRLSDVAKTVDVLIVVFRSNYYGERLKIGKSDIFVWSTNTVIEAIELID